MQGHYASDRPYICQNDDHRRIAESLAKLVPESAGAIDAVTSVVLKGNDPGDRSWASLSLRGINHPRSKKKAIPALITALKDSDDEVRGSAAQALGHICEESATVVPALIEQLNNDKSKDVQVQAAQALGEFGPEAKPAIPALTRALKDTDADVRLLAAQSLEQIKTWKKKRGQKGLQEQAAQLRKARKEIEERKKD